MLLKRLAVLCFLWFITACGTTADDVLEHADTVLDIYQMVQPLWEKAASDIATSEARLSIPSNVLPIKKYFTFASMPNCVFVDDNNYTLQSIGCFDEHDRQYDLLTDSNADSHNSEISRMYKAK
jgi:hypothetical protein